MMVIEQKHVGAV